jgi:Fe-S-cluster-containing hydrogenase component 2
MRNATTKRAVIKINEELCNGCGQCASACHEGAIRMVGGKARLVSESYCDGLGACTGECPVGALSIEEREADVFMQDKAPPHSHEAALGQVGHSCPHSAPRSLPGDVRPAGDHVPGTSISSALRNWPVQISLIPVNAPWLKGADLLVSADCVPFSLAGFHERMLAGKMLMIGCPKLDQADEYREKLALIFSVNDICSVEVVRMEVPCCGGLVHLVQEAVRASGKSIPCTLTKISIEGEILERRVV